MSDSARIYVADLAAYNDGILHGVWIDVDESTDVDSLNEQVESMLSKSPIPGAEEYAIHDFEGFPSGLVGEYTSLAEIAEIGEAIGEHGDMFRAYVDAHGSHYWREFDAEKCVGKYNSAEDWAWEVYGESRVSEAIDALTAEHDSVDADIARCVRFDWEDLVLTARANWNYTFAEFGGVTYVFTQ